MDQQLKDDIYRLRLCVVKERWSDNKGPDGLEGGSDDAQALLRCLSFLERMACNQRDREKCKHRMRKVDPGSKSFRYGWRRVCVKCGHKER